MSEISFSAKIFDENYDIFRFFDSITDGEKVSEFEVWPQGRRWFLPVYRCKATPLYHSWNGQELSGSWHVHEWKVEQDERWFARLLRWSYFKWGWIRNKWLWEIKSERN